MRVVTDDELSAFDGITALVIDAVDEYLETSSRRLTQETVDVKVIVYERVGPHEADSAVVTKQEPVSLKTRGVAELVGAVIKELVTHAESKTHRSWYRVLVQVRPEHTYYQRKPHQTRMSLRLE